MSKRNPTGCVTCGQVLNVPEYDARLNELYGRLKSGVQYHEALVFDSQWLQENVEDDEDNAAVMGAMERDMVNRGLCPRCSRPTLAGKTDDDFYTEEEVKELSEMYAEMAAERRAGC